MGDAAGCLSGNRVSTKESTAKEGCHDIHVSYMVEPFTDSPFGREVVLTHYGDDGVEKNGYYQFISEGHNVPKDVRVQSNETVDEQYKRLFLESALPVAIDNGEEMIVASYGGKHQEGHPFPEHVNLLHRDANGNEVLGMYEFVLAEEAPEVDKLFGTIKGAQDEDESIDFCIDVGLRDRLAQAVKREMVRSGDQEKGERIMGMSSNIKGIKEPDAHWKKMKAIWDSCEAAGVKIPDEVQEFFGYEPPDHLGVVVDIPHGQYLAEMHEGFEVRVKDIPKDVTVIRFWNSY